MVSALEKARSDPASMKARILSAARKLFGVYGYYGTTTRMIAAEVGIDISTLYYHWGEKQDLYEAVIMDVNEEIKIKLKDFEEKIKGKSLAERIELSIDEVCDYLFFHPEVSKLILFRYFSKSKQETVFVDLKVPEYITHIAISMGLAMDEQSIPIHLKTGILAIWNSVFNFIAGEHFFRPVLNVDHETYIQVVKETLKFILMPSFVKKTA